MQTSVIPSNSYRGRLAPSPTGFLHLGHARTFWIAQERAIAQHGVLVLRNEDLDIKRSKREFTIAMLEDLHWFGFQWHEGPDVGGPFGPYSQSQRREHYVDAFEKLHASGTIYPCTCSRRDVLRALRAPHVGEEEPVYPGTCRNKPGIHRPLGSANGLSPKPQPRARVNWRLRVPDGEFISFNDGYHGPQRFLAGNDFGDFVVWRHDGLPSYQLAVVVDDALMHVTEVVRGADLLISTARQLLLYRALAWTAPAFFHCPLLTDSTGTRLAKRHDALSLRALRAKGLTSEQLRQSF